jgi:hypothetical protein
MVGLKRFWILISSLFIFSACVPQTKQTECGSNEAFNASLRTCVPIVGGPSSFINITSYSPMFTQTRSKDDPTTLTFSIGVSNPYNQSYSVEWERVFNAGPESLCSNALTCSFPAAYLGTTLGQIGTHIITAKIKDGNGAVVDTHSFELKINDFPKPAINTATLVPANYSYDKYPNDPSVQFSFTIKNNNASISAPDNYRTVWTVIKNGSSIYTETDTFTNFLATGTNTAYLGVSPTPYFNPATLGVGNYLIRATVQNDTPGEVLAEQQWSIIIKQPDLAKITNISLPAPGVTITAHNGVDYNDYPTRSWIYGSTPTQPNFCVTVDDRDGTYAGDAKSIQVRWYLDGVGGEICTKTTLDTPGTQTLCLNDANTCLGTAAVFDVNLLEFINTSDTVTTSRKVTARLFDEASSYEFDRSNVIPSTGSYPIEWRVDVRPTNTAPVFGFGSTNPTGCTSAGAFARNSCAVTQGSNFTVSFTVTDDFYSPTADADQFLWDVKLKRSTADLTTPDVSMNTSCQKVLGGATTSPASRTTGYTTQWTCSLNVPHYSATGPLNPSSGTYQVVLTGEDSGSPIGGPALTSQSLTWNLNVTESNPASPGITLETPAAIVTESHVSKSGTVLDPGDSTSYARELETILFRMKVTDPELDDFQYRVSLCTDNTSACTTSVVLTSPAYVSFIRSIQVSPIDNPVLANGLLYTLPENFLISLHASAIDIDTNTSRLAYFKVDIVDVPSVLATPTRTDFKIFSVNVRNYNPAPVINTATAAPALNSTTSVYAGFPFTIDPGTVSDASNNSAENVIQYQWYAKDTGAWTAITGATSRVLRYTPGQGSSTIELKLCVGDGTAANPISSTGNCSGSWYVTPNPSIRALTATGAASLGNEIAVWYDSTNTVPNTHVIYTAYVDSANKIFVEKTVRNTTGTIVLSHQTVELRALASGTVSSVSNLSISGSQDSVYIAYLASASTAPGNMIPRVRRIYKSFSSPTRIKSGMPHMAPFRVSSDYSTHYSLSASVGAPVTLINGDGAGSNATITFSAVMSGTQTITINGVVFTADADPTANPLYICTSATCPDTTSMAVSLRDKINASTDYLLQGIVAESSGAVVTLWGNYHNDYYDIPYLAAPGGLGNIIVSGGRWHLPFVNSSLAGAQYNNITVVSANVDVHLNSSPATVALNTNDTLDEVGQVAQFDSKLNTNGELVVAAISGASGTYGQMSLYRYTLTGSDWAIFDTTGGSATDQNSKQIFGTYAFEYVKLAPNTTGNNFYYVIGREMTIYGAKYLIGRYNYELDSAAAVSENLITNKVLATDSTSSVITNSTLKFPDLISIPNFSEARIIFHSVGSGATPYPRMARWKADDTITCGTCFPLNQSYTYKTAAKIGVSQVVPDLALGASGATANEHINDTVFLGFVSDIAGTSTFVPQLGIINAEAKAIQSTAVNATLFQPPYVLDQ